MDLPWWTFFTKGFDAFNSLDWVLLKRMELFPFCASGKEIHNSFPFQKDLGNKVAVVNQADITQWHKHVADVINKINYKSHRYKCVSTIISS